MGRDIYTEVMYPHPGSKVLDLQIHTGNGAGSTNACRELLDRDIMELLLRNLFQSSSTGHELRQLWISLERGYSH